MQACLNIWQQLCVLFGGGRQERVGVIGSLIKTGYVLFQGHRFRIEGMDTQDIQTRKHNQK